MRFDTLCALRARAPRRSTLLGFIMPIRVVPVPALEDNYMYVLIDEETKQCGVVDPVDAAAI